MEEKARLKRLGVGAAATRVLTMLAAIVFASIAVPLALALGLGATLLLGGGLAKK